MLMVRRADPTELLGGPAAVGAATFLGADDEVGDEAVEEFELEGVAAGEFRGIGEIGEVGLFEREFVDREALPAHLGEELVAGFG